MYARARQQAQRESAASLTRHSQTFTPAHTNVTYKYSGRGRTNASGDAESLPQLHCHHGTDALANDHLQQLRTRQQAGGPVRTSRPRPTCCRADAIVAATRAIARRCSQCRVCCEINERCYRRSCRDASLHEEACKGSSNASAEHGYSEHHSDVVNECGHSTATTDSDSAGAGTRYLVDWGRVDTQHRPEARLPGHNRSTATTALSSRCIAMTGQPDGGGTACRVM